MRQTPHSATAIQAHGRRDLLSAPTKTKKGDDEMSGEISEEKKKELEQAAEKLFTEMPQSDPMTRLSACFKALANASGLDDETATRAAASFATDLHQEYAEVLVHRRNGAVDSYVIGPDFDYDIRPRSPYYTSTSDDH